MIPPLPFGTLPLSLIDDVHLGEALPLSSKGGEGDRVRAAVTQTQWQCPFGREEGQGRLCSVSDRPTSLSFELDSGFGIRISFGFRPSAFGLTPPGVFPRVDPLG